MKNKFKFSTTQVIAIGFIILIAIGTLLLMSGAASAGQKPTSLVDAMFTATSASCVTGLVTVNTLEHWSLFGQIVILVLIQFGGLGVVTFTTVFLILTGKRISLSQRMVIQDAYNLDTLKGLVKITKRVVISTFFVEGIGALLYMIRFVPAYGAIEGMWKSIFTSVSAFCNAGIDILGADSLAAYKGDALINLTTMALIIVAGLGFPVWWDILDVGHRVRLEKIRPGMIFKKLSLQSKLVLTTTAVLISFGGIFILMTDFNHASSLGTLPLHEKIMGAFFQSVTLRTAGFQTIPQEAFSQPAQLVSVLLMFIGGSPGGTAGGVKTVTFAVIILSVLAILKGDKDIEAYNRKISDNMLRKGLAVVTISMSMLVISIISLSLLMPEASVMDIVYEATSAIATVGLSRNFTTSMTTAAKLVIVLTMYIGRIGPISMALAFNARSKSKKIGRQLPEEKIMVG